MKQQIKSTGWMFFFMVCLFMFPGCPMTDDQGDVSGVTTIPLTFEGATHLIAVAGNIMIGHNTYSSGGCLQYYDPAEETVETTGVTGIDVAKLAYHSATKRIFFINSSSTYYIDTTQETGSWEAVQINSGPAPGSDMVLHDDTVYVVNTSYTTPYVNTLYIIDADTATLTDTINLNQGAPSADEDGLTKIGVDTSHNRLYFTDTWNGNIYSCTLTGTDIVYETTTASNATGPIYFSGSSAYVLVGGGTMGVHTFNVTSPGASTTLFVDSADISVQYMVFRDADTAYVTNYVYGVFEFDPGDTSSDFTIMEGTDPTDKTGFQDIIYDDNTLYTTVNNYPNESYLMIIEIL